MKFDELYNSLVKEGLFGFGTSGQEKRDRAALLQRRKETGQFNPKDPRNDPEYIKSSGRKAAPETKTMGGTVGGKAAEYVGPGGAVKGAMAAGSLLGKFKGGLKQLVKGKPKKLSTYDDNPVGSKLGQKISDIQARSRRVPKDLPTDVKAPGTDAGDLYHGLQTTRSGATVRSPLHPTVSRTGKGRKWDTAGKRIPSTGDKYGVGQKYISPELGQGSDKQKALKTVRNIFKKDRSYQGIHKMRTGPSASVSRSLPLPQRDYKSAQLQQHISKPKIKDLLLPESAKGASLGDSLNKTIKWLTRGKVDIGSIAQKRLDKISPPTTTKVKVTTRSGSPVDQIIKNPVTDVPGKPSGLPPRKR